MNKTIWCLFSIANEWDRPKNNLEAWWTTKPTIAMMAQTLGIKFNPKKGHTQLGRIYKGAKHVLLYNDSYTGYRLQEIREEVHVET